MRITRFRSFKTARLLRIFSFSLSIILFASVLAASAQSRKPRAKRTAAKKTSAANLPKVTQIDQAGLANLIKRPADSTKPLLINFWATWCDPCREEFPDLVKLDADYKGKIDFITISLDELAELKRGVPAFLNKTKAEMPAYLLKTDDEEAAILSVAKEWSGGLPFTILFDAKGNQAYFRQGKISSEKLRSEIDKLTTSAQIQASETNLPLNQNAKKAEDGANEAKADIAKGLLVIKRYGLTAEIPEKQLNTLKKKYNIEVSEHGCVLLGVTPEYFSAYNEVMKQEISKRYGHKVLKQLPL